MATLEEYTMPELVETNQAIEQMEEQLVRSQSLAIEHLEILAAHAGRFVEDRFCIFFHELQLRKAIAAGKDVDVEYARIKIKNFAEEQVNLFMTLDLIRNHVTAVSLPGRNYSLETLLAELERDEATQQQHRSTIRNLRV